MTKFNVAKALKAGIVAGGVSAILFSASAFGNHTWSTYHWAKSGSSMPLKVVDSVTADWQFELDISIDEWNQSSVMNMSIDSADDSKKARRRCTMVPGQMRVCNNSYGRNGWLGLASIGLDSNGHIDQGTAKMNDTYASSWTPDQKRHVMCQEIGHVFGLNHTSVDGSSQMTCMDYSQDPQSISPNAHDYQMLADMYAHADSYNSYDDSAASTSGGGNPGGGKPSGRGNAGMDIPRGILVSKSGRSEMWVASRADGGYWVHHIYLAEAE